MEEDFLALELSHLQFDLRSSPDRLDTLLSDAYLEFGRSGRANSKAEIIAHLSASPELPGGDCCVADLVQFRAVLVAPEVVLVTYWLRGALRSSLWRRENQTWRVLFHQGTPAAAPPIHVA